MPVGGRVAKERAAIPQADDIDAQRVQHIVIDPAHDVDAIADLSAEQTRRLSDNGFVVIPDEAIQMFYLYEEKRGNVGLLLPDPEKFNLVSSFRITDGSGPHWAHPFIRDGKMFLRHGEVLMVFKIQ